MSSQHLSLETYPEAKTFSVALKAQSYSLPRLKAHPVGRMRILHANQLCGQAICQVGSFRVQVIALSDCTCLNGRQRLYLPERAPDLPPRSLLLLQHVALLPANFQRTVVYESPWPEETQPAVLPC